MESRLNSSGTFSQDSQRYSSATKSKVYCAAWEKHHKISQEEFFSCRWSTTFLVEQETMNKNVWQTLDSLEKGQWSFIGPGSEKKWCSMKEDTWQGIRDKLAEKMLIEFAESGCPIFRAMTPMSEVNSQAKAMVNCRYTMQPTRKRLRHFRIIVSATQLSLYGAVAEMCEVYETLHDRSVQPVVGGQSSSSLVLSVIKTEVHLDNDDPVNKDLL